MTQVLRIERAKRPLTWAVATRLEESDENVDEDGCGCTCHTYAGGMREDADHPLVRAVGSGTVCERNNSKREQPSEYNADRQSCEARCSQT